jgi:hypothetical protein
MAKSRDTKTNDKKKTPKELGRDKNKINLLELLLKNMGNITRSCKELGINRSTFYDWYNSDESFKKKYKEINEVILDFAEDNLIKRIDEGNITALIYFLNKRGESRGYGEKSNVASNVPQITIVNDLDSRKKEDKD